MTTNKTFYITTPIYYPNAKLHMGHAYTTTICDILARSKRLQGDEVYFLTGADENTGKVVRAAKDADKETKEYLDEIILNFKNLFEKLEISEDQFIRTSDEKNHWPGVVEIWKRLEKAGDIEKRSYEGLYCVGHEAFITEKDLVDGKCPEHNEVPQRLKEENYFFKLSKYTEQIKEKIKSGEMEIIPESRKNEILALLDRGLEDISFSRSAEKMSVGIPVPGDSSQKIYVWGDALVNYISALGFGRDDELYKKFWPGMHVIGKDILRFHAAIWPGMLLSAGLPLPKKILVHGFITSGGKKMSKSLGNTIDPLKLIEDYGAEAVRYYLARHISPFEDGDLTEESFKDAYNAGLANGLGNLTSRIMTMAVNYGVKLENYVQVKPAGFDEKIDNFDLKSAIDLLWLNINYLDGFIQTNQPFKKIKNEPEVAKKDIQFLLNDLMSIAELLQPFLPQTSAKIIDLIKQNKKPEKPLFARKD
jgi:methionyl-tRNA synthetase